MCGVAGREREREREREGAVVVVMDDGWETLELELCVGNTVFLFVGASSLGLGPPGGYLEGIPHPALVGSVVHSFVFISGEH